MRIDNTTVNFTIYREKKNDKLDENSGTEYILENGQMNFDADRYFKK